MPNKDGSFPSKIDISVHKRSRTLQFKKQEARELVLDKIRSPEIVVGALMAEVTRRFRNGSRVCEFELKLNVANFVDWASEARLLDASMTTKQRAEQIRKAMEKATLKLLKDELKKGSFGQLTCRLIQGGKIGFQVKVSVIHHD